MSIICSTQEQFEHNEALITRYQNGDKTLSELDMVTLRRLALTGHKNTRYAHSKNSMICIPKAKFHRSLMEI